MPFYSKVTQNQPVQQGNCGYSRYGVHTVLQAKAEAEGLPSVEAWIEKLAEPQPAASPPRQHIARFIAESMRDVPPEIMATMPTDGASQHDHYIYGWPKRDV